MVNKFKNINKQLLKLLHLARNEKDIENAWRAIFIESGFEVSSPCGTDGLILNDKCSALLEFKKGKDFESPLELATILVQQIFYLKNLEKAGIELPRALFLADENECSCLPVDAVLRYLHEKVDWTTPPSSAASKNPKLVAKLAADTNLCMFIYKVDERFEFGGVLKKLEYIAQGKQYAMTIKKTNIVSVFEMFTSRVLKAGRVSDVDKVDIFFTCMTNPDEAYLHPGKSGKLVCRGKEYPVNSSAFISFFEGYRRKYSLSELKDLTPCKDQLFAEVYRRRTGAFFTPSIWADEAHKMMTEELGEGWRDEYVVWDPCCGTAQLTRGYKFRELYLSTLEQGDIDTIRDCGYNPEATCFQYDFLSEVELGPKVPEGLKKAIKDGRKIAVLMNPPYGRAGNSAKKRGKSSQTGLAVNEINTVMKQMKIGASCQQLYAQFLYRCFQFNCIVGCFSKGGLFCKSSFEQFREKTKFECKSVMAFRANEFEGTSSNWPVLFSVWRFS